MIFLIIQLVLITLLSIKETQVELILVAFLIAINTILTMKETQIIKVKFYEINELLQYIINYITNYSICNLNPRLPKKIFNSDPDNLGKHKKL